MLAKFILSLWFIFLCSNAYAAVLFEDNFDSSPDWQSNQTTSKDNGGEDIAVVDDPSDGCIGDRCPPSGWYGYYVAASYWADRGEDTYLLSSEGAYGGTGKGLTYNHESVGTWAGGRLFIWLGETGYDELYARMRIKYEVGWEWNNGAGNAQQKWMRISSFWGDALGAPAEPWNQYQSIGLNESVFYPDMYYNGAFESLSFQVACNASPNYVEVDWMNYPGYPAIDDGQWHVLEYRVKMNSVPGIADGEYESWVDGAQFNVRTDIEWRQAGSVTTWGWNCVLPLDNMYTSFDPSIHKEQKLYMDDIVISTEYVGTEYVIGTPSTAPTVDAGPDQSISVSTATISGTATASTGRTIASVACPGETVTPDDGAWDELEEVWTCVLEGLPEGRTTKTFTATDDQDETGQDSVEVNYTPGGALVIVEFTSSETSTTSGYELVYTVTAPSGEYVVGSTVNSVSVPCYDGACDEQVEEFRSIQELSEGSGNGFTVWGESSGGSNGFDFMSVTYIPGHVVTIGNSGPPTRVGNSGTVITVLN